MQLSKTKDSDGSLPFGKSPLMKISLFYKQITIVASSLFVIVILVLGVPAQAHAGFFSDMVSKVMGTAQAGEQPEISSEDGNTYNSQNIPLLESNVTPLSKDSKDDKSVTIVGDQALEANISPLGPESDIEQYASTAKITIYKVKKGDTISSIIKQFNLTEGTFLASNPDIKKGDKLKIGQSIVVIPIKTKEKIVPKVEKVPVVETKKVVKPIENPKVEEKVKEVVPTPAPVVIPSPTLVKEQSSEVVTPTVPVEKIETPVDNGPEGQQGTISGGYIWPFPAGVGRVSQGLHADQAYDFAAPIGTPIYAVSNGTVLIARDSGYNGGYGKYVVINFNDGRQAIFGHMTKVLVKAGDEVHQGDIIGKVGSTGKSTGPHLHAGFRGTLANPYLGLKVNATGLPHDE